MTLTETEGHWIVKADHFEAALWAQGWVHARTRADEALFARALFRSELSQSHKPGMAHSEIDAFIRSWGFDENLRQERTALSPEHMGQLLSYARGFEEQRQSQRLWPWQRHEYPATPWQPEDSLLLSRTFGFMSWWETRGELTWFLLELIQKGVDWARLCDLIPDLGDEPDRRLWDSLQRPAPLSPEATSLLGKLRRWRTGVRVNGSSWGVSMVTDVTEPGLPFLEMRFDLPEATIRGLSLPGLPGLLTGRSRHLTWNFSPSWGDIVDFRLLREGGMSMKWAGQHKTGTLACFLRALSSTSVSQLRRATENQGSAALTLMARDEKGHSQVWELGSRWKRVHPRDAWLPSVASALVGASGSMPPHPVQLWLDQQQELPLRSKKVSAASLLTAEVSLQATTLLSQLRFLLPETEQGNSLRRWAGQPSQGPESQLFQRVCTAVLRAFWNTSGVIPDLSSPPLHLLAPAIDRLLGSAHSAWLPSSIKNQVLRQAVHAELAQGTQVAELTSERLFSPRFLYWETLAGHSRVFAAVVIVTAEAESDTLSVFLTDDENEPPVFHEL